MTTRPKRHGEQDGVNYRFVTRPQFEAARDAGELLEWAQYLGNLYGTPAAPAKQAIARGEFVILEIDVQGGAHVARQMPDSVRIFVLPPTQQTLEARLRGRQTESAQQQQQRLAQADGEIAFARDSGCYPYFVTNDILEQTVQEVLDIIREHGANA